MDKKLLSAIEIYQQGRDMSRIRESLWLKHFLELIGFKEKFGHTNVSQYSHDNKKLAHWVARQRKLLNVKAIEADRGKLLQLLGFEVILNFSWDAMYNQLCGFRAKHGHTNVPYSSNYQKLNTWVVRQKSNARKGKLDKGQCNKLKSLGIIVDIDSKIRIPEKNYFQTERDKIWKMRFRQLVEFKKQHGHLHVTNAYTGDKQLLNFVHGLKYRHVNISKKEIKQLEDIGFLINGRYYDEKEKWDMPKWLKFYEQLKTFREEQGHCRVPSINKELNRWVNKQKKDKNLNEEKRALLEKLNFFERLNAWNQKMDQLAEFKKQHGHLDIHQSNTQNKQLLNFVTHIRRNKHKLSEEKIEKLNDLNFIWKPSRKVDYSKWLKKYEEVKEFKEKYGNFSIPKTNPRHVSLQAWLYAQRNNENLNEEQKKLLQEIGFFEDKQARIIKRKRGFVIYKLVSFSCWFFFF